MTRNVSRPRRAGVLPTRAASVLFLALTALGLRLTAAAAEAPAQGVGYDKLADKVDPLVRDLIEKEKLPGVTVAVTVQGRLVLARGYGYANAQTKAPMTYMHRSRIGSVSKAAVTGPCAYQVMKAKGIDPKTKRLYGPNGVLGTDYDGAIDAGTKRYQPIVALSIDAQDRAHAWYASGTMSIGATNNLDQYQSPRSYTLAEGKTPADIREIGIARNGRAYAWYDDGRVSVGTPTDLDAFSPLSEKPVKLPAGKSMLDIVGIDIAKSDDHVYVWYEDGTVSAGTSVDFDAYRKPEKVVYPEGGGVTRYNVRGMGIAKNDRVYTWFAYGKACSGTTNRLTEHQGPYNYTAAPVAGVDWKGWYSQITIQHLLDHRSGFSRNGEPELAQRMYNRTEAGLTYDQAHRHFLTTRKLLFAPGTRSSYSNHGFGLWTLMIERLAGKPFPSYARDAYLKPMGLQDRVVPETLNPTSLDAWSHEMSGSKLVPLPFEQTYLGLAAGGFRASARDLVQLMRNLDGKYTDAELDSMGWGNAGRGKLEHNGRRAGGTAYTAMFPNGYKARNGADLSRVHVAVVTNIWADTGELEKLADAIVLAVPTASIPSNYDAWNARAAAK